MTDDRAPYLGVVVAAAAIHLLHSAHYVHAWIDDAYITFRYARNLAAGEGLVFNAGERVEGLTNLGWAAVMAPFTSGDPLFAARIIGTAFALGTLLLLAGWAMGQRMHPVAAAVALAPSVLLPWAPFWAVQGLETPAVAFFVTLGWTRHAAELRALDAGVRTGALSALGLGLAPIFRPDAAMFAPLVAAWHLWSRRRIERHALRSAAWVVACAGALVGFKLAWFGAVLPQTFAAKARPWPWYNGWQYAASFFQVPSPIVAGVLTLAVVAALGLAARRRPGGLPALVVVAGFAGAIATNGDFFANYRFFVPLLPAAGACLGLAAHAVATRAGGIGWPVVAVAVAGVFLPGATVGQADRLRDDTLFPTTSAVVTRKTAPLWFPWRAREWRRGMSEQWVWPAAWVMVRTRPEERVAFTDIGLLSFLNPNPVVDLLGLTDPRFVPRRGSNHAEFWREMRRKMPGYAEFMVLERGSDRWQRLRPDRSERWWTADGCGNVRVYASDSVQRPLGAADDLDARIEAMFRHFPRFPSLHVAVVREMLAAGVDEARITLVVARARSLVTTSMEPVLDDLACQAGLREGCTARPELCNGGLPQERAAD